MRTSRLLARRRTHGASVAALVVLGTLNGGCNSTGRDEGPTASAVQHPTLEGVPLPSGFTIVDDRSVGRSSGTFRVAKYEFLGPTDRATVNRFYKEYMPSGGWTLKQDNFDRGEYEMRFESAAEECIVRIRPSGNRTAIVINLGPLARGSADREARPPLRRPKPAAGDDE